MTEASIINEEELSGERSIKIHPVLDNAHCLVS